MIRNKKFLALIVAICVFMLGSSNIIYALGSMTLQGGKLYRANTDNKKVHGWYSTGINSWYYYDMGAVKTGWLKDKNDWYYLSTKAEGNEGLMKYGWYKNNNKWYFLNTLHNGTFGSMLTGWQWIDGYCYLFREDGSLYQNTITPDGYSVDSKGRWIVDFKAQYIKGKGIASNILDNVDTNFNTSSNPGLKEEDIKRPKIDSAYLNNSQNQEKNKAKEGDESNKDTYRITYDFNYDNKVEVREVKAGAYAPEIDIPYREGYYFLSWYESKAPKELKKALPFDLRNTAINHDKTIYAIWIDTVNDSDGDGLGDGLETMIGTNINDVDTDNDGLSDYAEYYICVSDPLNPFTFIDGIYDSEIDYDRDGLTEKEEVEFGSSPLWKDYDKDGLNDKEEKEYGTDPENPDTDEDGINDGVEVKYGFNPLVKDTNGDGIEDGNEILSITKLYEGREGSSRPEALIRLRGAGLNELTIQRDDPRVSTWIQEDVPGLLDAAYDFTATSDIEEALLTFYFDEKYTEETKDFYPAVYYVDTQNQKLILLEEQSIDWENHKVTAKTSHFSKYVLLNKKEQDKVWKGTLLSGEKINASIEVAFVIDESWSMEENDKNKVRVDVVKSFIDTLRQEDKAAIIGFSYTADTYKSMTGDLESVKNSLKNISNFRAGTNLSAGLEKAMAEFPVSGEKTNEKEKAMKLIVMLTDGQGTYNEKYEQIAVERGIKIYTVGLGKSYDTALLKKISGNTGAKHYHADNSDELIEEFEKLTRETIDIVTDSDNDGLSDYHEERIRLFNGKMIKLNKENPDTDGDGLKDGEEIIQRTDIKGRVYFSLYSYPNKKDSDEDGINDKEDSLPLMPNSIDYLGSPKHLKSINERALKIEEENTIPVEGGKMRRPTSIELARYISKFMMDDYKLFLSERGINIEGKYREDYWKAEWDKYWEEYCNKMNECIRAKGHVNKEEHYFRNNLNRIPDTLDDMVKINSLTQKEKERLKELEKELDELIAGKEYSMLNTRKINKIQEKISNIKKLSNKWWLLATKDSIYHMHDTEFCENGLYNFKFLSPDGKHEGVYINSGGKNQGKACTDKTDPVNMGTYNYDGRYIDNKFIYGAGHYFLDIQPYDKWGNVSPEDKKGTIDSNKYKSNQSAIIVRSEFLKGWDGR